MTIFRYLVHFRKITKLILEIELSSQVVPFCESRSHIFEYSVYTTQHVDRLEIYTTCARPSSPFSGRSVLNVMVTF